MAGSEALGLFDATCDKHPDVPAFEGVDCPRCVQDAIARARKRAVEWDAQKEAGKRRPAQRPAVHVSHVLRTSDWACIGCDTKAILSPDGQYLTIIPG